MQTIKLKDGHSSFHTVTKYPDGQRTIKLNLEKLNIKQPINIICRIKNFYELEILLCLYAALIKNDFVVDCINFLYLFGLRSDRAFEIGQPNYLRDVLTPILKILKCRKFLLCPHSFFSETTGMSFEGPCEFFDKIPDNALKIGGDRSYNWSKVDTAFNKKRDAQGNISIEVIDERIEAAHHIVIIDDLVDGGATFIRGAQYLREKLHYKGKLTLAVVHGLFTQGFDSVADHFDKILCTNSYQEIEHPKFEVINVW